MQDMAGRLADKVRLTSDGHKAYLEAVETALESGIDYDIAGEGRYRPGECVGVGKEIIEGRPDPKHISTSCVERQTLI